MICEGCGKECNEEYKPYCLDCYVECMENYDQAMAEGIAEFILKMGQEPGVEIHFPTDEGLMMIKEGKIEPSKFGKVSGRLTG